MILQATMSINVGFIVQRSHKLYVNCLGFMCHSTELVVVNKIISLLQQHNRCLLVLTVENMEHVQVARDNRPSDLLPRYQGMGVRGTLG